VTYHLSGGCETTVVSNVTYYPFGPVATITYGNGRTLTRTYDQDYVIGSVIDTTSGKTDGLSLTFGRDVMGNLTQVNSSSTVGNLLTYDPLDRLTNVNDLNNNPVWTYTYDATGNRLSKQAGTAAAVSYAYSSGPTPPASHRLQAVGTVARGYDAMGNTTSIGGTAYGFTYDDTARMTQVKTSGTVIKAYQYNALGQRVRKSHANITSEIQKAIYDESGKVLADLDYNSNLIDEYIWMDDLPIAMLAGSTSVLEFIEPDHLGTPRVAIDAASNTQSWNWPLVNDPFGETQPTGTFTLNLRFPGQVYDAESGMNYNYFRDYEPATGRYVESDPIGLRGDNATYGYADESPLSYMDPIGLFTTKRICPTCSDDNYNNTFNMITEKCSDAKLRRITNIPLRKCIKNRCDHGTVFVDCDADDKCKNRTGWSCEETDKASAARGEVHLCVNSPRSEDGGYGGTVIHEWAHTCNWTHHMDMGVYDNNRPFVKRCWPNQPVGYDGNINWNSP